MNEWLGKLEGINSWLTKWNGIKWLEILYCFKQKAEDIHDRKGQGKFNVNNKQ